MRSGIDTPGHGSRTFVRTHVLAVVETQFLCAPITTLFSREIPSKLSLCRLPSAVLPSRAGQIRKTDRNLPFACLEPNLQNFRNIYWVRTRHSIDSSDSNVRPRNNMDRVQGKLKLWKPHGDTCSRVTFLTPARIISDRRREATRPVILFMYCYNGVQR